MVRIRGRGLPESMSVILLSFLVVIIVLLVAGMLTGFAGLLHQTPLVAVRGSVLTTPAGASVLVLIHSGGTTVGLNAGSAGDGPPPVLFTVTTFANVTSPVGLSDTAVNRSWGPGDEVYLYEDGKGYWVTDSISARLARSAALGPVTDILPEPLTVRVTDAKTNLVVASIVFVPGSARP